MNRHLGENQKIIKRLKELAKLIDKHNYHYHNEDKPKINDADYDKLVINSFLETKFIPHRLRIIITQYNCIFFRLFFHSHR